MKTTQCGGDNHFKLLIDNKVESYVIDGYEKSFKNIDNLLRYYHITPRITNIGQQCLTEGHHKIY